MSRHRIPLIRGRDNNIRSTQPHNSTSVNVAPIIASIQSDPDATDCAFYIAQKAG